MVLWYASLVFNHQVLASCHMLPVHNRHHFENTEGLSHFDQFVKRDINYFERQLLFNNNNS